MGARAMVPAALVVALLVACSGQEPPPPSGPPLPVDTTPQKPPVADTSEPVVSGNTPAAADIAAIAALGASFDPNRSAANDLETAKVEAKRGGKRIVLELGDASCGECERCLAGHESTCVRFAAPTIRPGGFAERVRAQGWVELPADWPDWRGTMVEPLACVLRGAARVPAGRLLVVGNGFIGRLFGLVLERRGDDVFAADTDPRRAGRAPDGPVDAVVLAGRGGVETALASVKPGGTVLVFADAGTIPAADVYRRELTVVGTRSAAPPYMPEAVALLHDLDVPEPTVLPLARFAEGLELHRRRDALKVVFTP